MYYIEEIIKLSFAPGEEGGNTTLNPLFTPLMVDIDRQHAL